MELDTHQLPLKAQTGLDGRFEISPTYTHTPDLHFVDDYVSYAPVNLAGITSLTFRVQAHAPGCIEGRLDAPDGPALAVVVPDQGAPGAGAMLAQLRQIETQREPHDASLAEGLNREAYENWEEKKPFVALD